MMTPRKYDLSSLRLTLSALFTIAIAGCVSVNIGPGSTERSKGVSYSAPSAPFQTLSETPADGAWQNKSNGNSISYLSTCNENADPALDIATRELFADLKSLVTIRSETSAFNGREALISEVEGKLDGVPTRIQSVVFKKNGCLYTITYVGIQKSFEEDRSEFETFVRSFEAP